MPVQASIAMLQPLFENPMPSSPSSHPQLVAGVLGRRCLAWEVLGCLQSACPASAAWRPPGATHRLRPCSSMLRTPSLPPKSLHHPGSSHCLLTGTAAAAAGTVPGLCSTGEACELRDQIRSLSLCHTHRSSRFTLISLPWNCSSLLMF